MQEMHVWIEDVDGTLLEKFGKIQAEPSELKFMFAARINHWRRMGHSMCFVSYAIIA